jgi:hypothetical protein
MTEENLHLKNVVFYVLTPCSLENDLRFGGIYRLHLESKSKPDKKPVNAGTNRRTKQEY